MAKTKTRTRKGARSLKGKSRAKTKVSSKSRTRQSQRRHQHRKPIKSKSRRSNTARPKTTKLRKLGKRVSSRRKEAYASLAQFIRAYESWDGEYDYYEIETSADY